MKQKYAFRSPPWLRKCVYGMVSAVMMCGLLVVGIGAEDSPPTLTPIPEGTVNASFVESSNYEKISLTFKGKLTAGSQYAIFVVAGEDVDNCDLLNDEILYINQQEATSDESISFDDSGAIDYSLYPKQIKNSVIWLSGDIDGGSRVIPVAMVKSAITVESIGNGSSIPSYELDGNTVTVTYKIPCKLGYADSNGKYVAIEATKVKDDTYLYIVPDGVKNVKLVVKGDANGDGRVSTADRLLLVKSLLKTTHDSYKGLNPLQSFSLELNGDGRVSTADRLLLVKSLLKTTHDSYKQLIW